MKDPLERLIDFWNYLSKESIVESNPFFKQWWDYWHAINGELRLEKLQDDTIQPKNLRCTEYQCLLILIGLDMTAGIMIHKIHGTVIIMNHYEEVWSDLQSFQLPPLKKKINLGSYWSQLTLLMVCQSHLIDYPTEDGSRKNRVWKILNTER